MVRPAAARADRRLDRADHARRHRRPRRPHPGTPPRSHADFPTALGHAIGYAARLFQQAPACDRRVLDISGDGANNDGYEPINAYRAFPLDDVTVNALVVGGIARPQLVRYFQTMVIHGPGAFAEIAEDYRDYARAMKRKLLREIRPPMAIGALPSEPRG